MEFFVGSSVEVCSNEDGFLGAYFEAKVVGRRGKHKLKVEYTTLLDKDLKGPLREEVRTSDVRPVPPPLRVSDFGVLDKVDAYDGDGWWVGRVTGRKEGSRYSVYFECSVDEYDYPASALRIHQEYENGQWVPSRRRGMGSETLKFQPKQRILLENSVL